MKKIIVFALLTLSMLGCNETEGPAVIQGKTHQEEISVVGKIAGRIDSLLVREGDFVNKGDTLAILSIPEVDAKRIQAQGALESADAQYQMAVAGATKNQLKQLAAKKRALTEQYEYAKKSVNRLENMVRDSLIPLQTFDEAYAKLQSAQAQLDAVEAEISDVEHGARLEQQVMALGQKNRALGALSEVRIAENERFILAPADMTVETITLKEGELALPGYTLFKGPLPGRTYFRFTLPENRLDQVSLNQQVKVMLVYADRKISGEVTTISPLSAYADISTAYPDYEMQQALFEIKITPEDPADAEEIISNTTVTLEL